MKKKGFTLIELLAVIVILAIIALILVPIVSSVIESARKTAFRESVNGMIDSTNNYVEEYILKHNNELNNYPVVFTCDGTSCKTSDNDVLTFKGNVPKSGNIIIKEDGVLAEYITDGKYCAYGYKWDLVVEGSCGEVDVTKPTITGTQNGKYITLVMADNESGVDKYCATTESDTTNCEWITPSDITNESYTIASSGVWNFYVRDKKGNISDSISFTTSQSDYCQIASNTVVYESGTVGHTTFEIPEGCAGSYKLEVWGAQGGRVGSGTGGKGGYSNGKIILDNNATLEVVVGGAGSGTTGGYNGGGNGGAGNSQYGAGGGGATHIASSLIDDGRLSKYVDNKDKVIIVAGGGGGTGYADSSVGSGGYGGGENGGSGYDGYNGCSPCFGATGATQSSGGYNGNATAIYGTFGQGANFVNHSYGGSGGGGGYYGGGGSNRGHGGAGGGSGYIGGVTAGNIIAGNQSMPTHDGNGTMTGNTGNGYVKITYVGDATVAISLDANGGTVNPPVVNIAIDDPIGELPVPTNGTKKFAGWYTSKVWKNPISSSTIASDNMLLYARWEGDAESFEYTGKVETSVVPVTGKYKLEVWGANSYTTKNWTSDGRVQTYSGRGGGGGGYVAGDITLTSGTVLYITCGSAASSVTDTSYGGFINWSSPSGGSTYIGENSANNILIQATGGGGWNAKGYQMGGDSDNKLEFEERPGYYIGNRAVGSKGAVSNSIENLEYNAGMTGGAANGRAKITYIGN